MYCRRQVDCHHPTSCKQVNQLPTWKDASQFTARWPRILWNISSFTTKWGWRMLKPNCMRLRRLKWRETSYPRRWSRLRSCSERTWCWSKHECTSTKWNDNVSKRTSKTSSELTTRKESKLTKHSVSRWSTRANDSSKMRLNVRVNFRNRKRSMNENANQSSTWRKSERSRNKWSEMSLFTILRRRHCRQEWSTSLRLRLMWWSSVNATKLLSGNESRLSRIKLKMSFRPRWCWWPKRLRITSGSRNSWRRSTRWIKLEKWRTREITTLIGRLRKVKIRRSNVKWRIWSIDRPEAWRMSKGSRNNKNTSSCCDKSNAGWRKRTWSKLKNGISDWCKSENRK